MLHALSSYATSFTLVSVCARIRTANRQSHLECVCVEILSHEAANLYVVIRHLY